MYKLRIVKIVDIYPPGNPFDETRVIRTVIRSLAAIITCTPPSVIIFVVVIIIIIVIIFMGTLNEPANEIK